MGGTSRFCWGRACELSTVLLALVILLAPAFGCSQAPTEGSRASAGTLGGFKTDEVALESAALALCSGGTGADLAYLGTFDTAPSVILMRYGGAAPSREQVAAKYPLAVAVAPAAGGKVVVSYIMSSPGGPQVNLAENRTGTWASTQVALAKPFGRLNATGVAVEPGGAAHVIFLNATHMGHHSNGTLSYLPADQVAPSIGVSAGGVVGIAVSSGGALQYATPWANATGFDTRTVSTTVRPDAGSRLALVYGPTGNPAIFFTSGGSAQVATLGTGWTVSSVAQGAVLAAAAGPDGMYHVLIENSTGGSSSSILYISGDSVGGWLTIDLGWGRSGSPAGITVAADGVVHIAVNTVLQGLLHGYRGAVPGPVRSLNATPGDRRANITWQAPADTTVPVQGYIIKHGTTPTHFYAQSLMQGNRTSYVERELTNDVTYYFTVTPYNEYGESRTSPVVVVTPSLSSARVPGPPTAVNATANLKGGIDLAWSAPADDGGADVTGYRVYRGTTVGDPSLLAQLPAGARAHSDAAATPETTYRYSVSALNAVGEGARSAPVECTALLGIEELGLEVTPQHFYLDDDGTGTFDIVVRVTGDGRPMAGANVTLEVEGRPEYTRHALTDAGGEASFPGFALGRETENGFLAVKAVKGSLIKRTDFNIIRTPPRDWSAERRLLTLTIIGGIVLLACTAAAGALVQHRRRRALEQRKKDLEDSKESISTMVDHRLSDPIKTGGSKAPVDGATLLGKWKEVLAGLSVEAGIQDAGPFGGATLVSASTTYLGAVIAHEERETVKRYITEIPLVKSFTITPVPEPTPLADGDYDNVKQVFFTSRAEKDCTPCSGTGSIPCRVCRGTKQATCGTCGGTRQGDCPECGGTGWVDCPTCASGQVPVCWACRGAGRKTERRLVSSTPTGGAYVSDGGRVVTDNDGRRVLKETYRYMSTSSSSTYESKEVGCTECGGTGYGRCPDCGGRGDGQVPCQACEQSGKAGCPACNGTGLGACTNCDPNGKVTCEACGGQGRVWGAETVEHVYTHHLLEERIGAEDAAFTGLTIGTEDGSFTEFSEKGPAPADAGEDKSALAKVVDAGKDMHSRWQGSLEGRPLFRSGWKVRVMPITTGVLSMPIRDHMGRDRDERTSVAAAGTSRSWWLRSGDAPALLMFAVLADSKLWDSRYRSAKRRLRAIVVAAVAVEGAALAAAVIWLWRMIP